MTRAMKKSVLRRKKRPQAAPDEIRFRAKRAAAASRRPNYELEVQYTGGHNVELDRQIAKLMCRPIAGSGMDLMSGVRDLQFLFGARRHAMLDAIERIRQLNVRRVRVFLRSFEEVR